MLSPISESTFEKLQQHKQPDWRCFGDDSSSEDEVETLRRARIIASMNASPVRNHTPFASSSAPVSESENDDEELVRNTLNQCGIAPLLQKPLDFIPGEASDEEEEYELLCAIKRRFAAYQDTNSNRSENVSEKHQQVRASSISSEKETSSNLLFLNKTNTCNGCPDTKDFCNTTQNLGLNGDKVSDNQNSGCMEWHQPDAHAPLKYSSFPKAAQAFVDAIKTNRSCQRLLRSKMIQIESKLEANKQLRERVKILKDFQASCRRITGRALSQKKNPLVQLISAAKVRASKNSKVNDKKVAAICRGPAENAHVSNYRMALTDYPISLSRDKWSKEENENLKKGIKQQFQQMSFQMSMDVLSEFHESCDDSIDLDAITTSISNLEITPEHMELFLPKVNWEQLASMYVAGRSGAECETRWLNWENPLINRSMWSNAEDKKLLCIVNEKGYYNWIDTSSLLGTNRTPFQCLTRFQRSLNTFIMKSEWTEDEDARLRDAVSTFGEHNWQAVATCLEGRSGVQCSNRWNKTLHPTRKREGRWSKEEDKYLKISVMLLGPKTWNMIAQFVPGRTQVQCRERWVNSLDPSLNWGGWTQEEDSNLKEAIAKFGYCWSKVAKHVPPRTDNQCLRRWRMLCPHEVPLLQAAKQIRKVALISNFVDRESERPSLGPNDFVPPPLLTDSIPPQKKKKNAAKQKRRRRRPKEVLVPHRDVPRRKRSNRPHKTPRNQDSSVCFRTPFCITEEISAIRMMDDEGIANPWGQCYLSPSPNSTLLAYTNGGEFGSRRKLIPRRRPRNGRCNKISNGGIWGSNILDLCMINMSSCESGGSVRRESERLKNKRKRWNA